MDAFAIMLERWWSLRGWLLVLPWILLACGGSDTLAGTEPSGTATSSTAPTAEETTSSGDASDEAGANPVPWPDVPHPSEDAWLECTRTCEGPWDCCPFGTQGQCPSPGYPFNFDCIEGICVPNGCRSDDDCLEENERCLYFDGRPDCVVPCEDDEVCQALDTDLTCSRQTDEGERFCFAHCETAGCGFLACDETTGRCACESSGQCPVDHECV